MSTHSHFQTSRQSAVVFVGLLFAFVWEVPAIVWGGQLAITAHILDIGADTLAAAIVVVGAIVSGQRDDNGRVHSDTEPHPEQLVIAYINCAILLIGGMVILSQSVFMFGQEEDSISWQDWRFLIGPLISLGIYIWLRDRLTKMSAQDITTDSLAQHVRGDVLIAGLVVLLTVINMSFETNWTNSAGGVVMSLILLYLAFGLAWKIRVAAKI